MNHVPGLAQVLHKDLPSTLEYLDDAAVIPIKIILETNLLILQ